ncbi:MAG: hypothetical protein PHD67_05950 [Oscillospiraceae bacterium]|nr:hypothetical protein [Oscillospiraceae bacterium]
MQWEPLSALDTETAGWAYLKGTLSAPDPTSISGGACALPEELRPVEFPIMVYEDGMESETLSSAFLRNGSVFWTPVTITMPAGGDPEDFLNFLTYHARCVAENGMGFECSVRWDTSALDPAVPGGYTVNGYPELPPCFAMPQGKPSLSVPVRVLYADRIDLSAPTLNSYGLVICQWYAAVEDFDALVLQYSINGGRWQKTALIPSDGGSPIYAAEGIPVMMTSTSLGVTPSALPSTADTYSFRLLYRGVASNILKVWYSEPEQSWMGMAADRDGGDYVGPSLPGLGQTPPGSEEQKPSDSPASDQDSPASDQDGSAPTAPESAPAAAAEEAVPLDPTPSALFLEEVTSSYTLLSGARLSQLLDINAETVLFEKQGVSLEIPAGFLRGLSLADDGRLKVELTQPEKDSFHLDIEVDGSPLTALSPSVARLPVSSPGEGELTCIHEESGSAAAVSYDSASGIAAVTVTATGTYRILSPLVPAIHAAAAPPAAVYVESAGPSGFLWAGSIFLLLSAGGAALFFFLRRRRHDSR